MRKNDYHISFETGAAPGEAFDYITNVGEWWTKSFKGGAGRIGDVFSVTFGATSVDFTVVESVPPGRLVWEVTDCHLDWLKDKKEWKGTRVVWEVSEKGKTVIIGMTHKGLVPGMECYQDCEKGWNEHVGESLPKLMSGDKGAIFEGSKG